MPSNDQQILFLVDYFYNKLYRSCLYNTVTNFHYHAHWHMYICSSLLQDLFVTQIS